MNMLNEEKDAEEQREKYFERQVEHLEWMARETREAERRKLERESRESCLLSTAVMSMFLSLLALLKDELKTLLKWIIGNF